VKFPKNKPLKSQKLRDSARGENCTMNSPECNSNPETVVLCHSNKLKHGKGTGLKADDRHAFYGCSGCHHWFDVGTADKHKKQRYYDVAVIHTHIRMRQKGLGVILDG